jgi:hypothetical protein
MILIVLAVWLLGIPVVGLALSALAARRATRPLPTIEVPPVPRLWLRPADRGLPCESRRRRAAKSVGAPAARTSARRGLRV